MADLMFFQNRLRAGELLAQQLGAYAGRGDVVVLALPRGGVPVGFAIAEALDAPLDILLVGKLGVPGQEEFAMGAITSGGHRELQADALRMLRISKQTVEAVAQRAMQEIRRREQLYRAGRPKIDVNSRSIILVDDGLATGCTMRAAVHVLREENPAHIAVAVPVAAPDTFQTLSEEVDEIICLHTPEPFYAVGLWYEDFGQTSDDEVTSLLEAAHRRQARRATPAKNR